PGNDAPNCGHSLRIGRSARLNPADDEFTVRGKTNRCDYIRRCPAQLVRRSITRLLHSRAKSDESRSAVGAQVRVANFVHETQSTKESIRRDEMFQDLRLGLRMILKNP